MNPNFAPGAIPNPNFVPIDNFQLIQQDIPMNATAPWNFIIRDALAEAKQYARDHGLRITAFRANFYFEGGRAQQTNNQPIIRQLQGNGTTGLIQTRNGATVTAPDIAEAIANLLDDTQSPFMGNFAGMTYDADVDVHFVQPRLGTRPSRGRRGVGVVGAGFYCKAGQIERYFEQTNAVLKAPHTNRANCFPMAFMKAQVRTFAFEGTKLVDIFESKPTQLPRNYITRMHESHGNFIIEAPLGNYRTDFYKDQWLVLFNGYKALDEDGKYRMDVSPDYAEKWSEAADHLHRLVEVEYEQDINYQDTEEAAPFYANYFQVHIHLYTFLKKGFRFKTYVPDSLQVLEGVRYEHHVHILLDTEQAHAHAITHVRNFVRKESTHSKLSLHNLCDYCGKTSYSSVTKEIEYKHIEECCVKPVEKRFDNHEIKVIAKKTNPFHEVMHMYPQKGKWVCAVCHMEMDAMDAHGHQCMIQTPSIPEPVEDTKLYVYDMEAMQDGLRTNEFKHTVNLIVLQSMYETENKRIFKTVEEYMESVLSEEQYDEAVFVAHNSGGYDAHFLFVYCEEHGIRHQIIPAAGSQHRYLSLSIFNNQDKKRVFIDFMSMMPGSLKSIAESFALEVSKGDFPHHMNTSAKQNYEGALPSEEYYGMNLMRSDEEMTKFYEFYLEAQGRYCTCVLPHTPENFCTKKLWNLQDELLAYCELDVEVLRRACILYREKTFSLPSPIFGDIPYRQIDPFSVLTKSQLGIYLFLINKPPDLQIACTQFIRRPFVCWQEQYWMSKLLETQEIWCLQTKPKEFYLPLVNRFFVGYNEYTKTLYDYLDCEHHCCPLCYHRMTGMHPTRNEDCDRIVSRRIEQNERIEEAGYRIVSMWGHDFERVYPEAEDSPYFHPMEDREFFYGGRTEVFKAFQEIEGEEEILYHDVCSLYPYVCAFCPLPISHPNVIHGLAIDRNRFSAQHFNPYYGFVKCKVSCPQDDILGLLPSRDPETGRLLFNLTEKIGCWHTVELQFAMSRGYQLVEVYEIHHFNHVESNVFRDYVDYFLSRKQQADGWRKNGCANETPTEEEKDACVTRMRQLNNGIGEMDKLQVQKNPVERAIAKLALNSLWGKFCQSNQVEYTTQINSWTEYNSLMTHPHIETKSLKFRYIKNQVFKVTYKKQKEQVKRNGKYNIYLAASVTAHARTILHRQMVRIGPERILYCDTDSIIFLYGRSLPRLDGSGLGNWVDEHPGEVITFFAAIAPKSYYLEIGGEKHLKLKGVSLTLENQLKVTKEAWKTLIYRALFPSPIPTQNSLSLSNFSIFPNTTNTQIPFSTMVSRYNLKEVRAYYSKRRLPELPQIGIDDFYRSYRSISLCPL